MKNNLIYNLAPHRIIQEPNLSREQLINYLLTTDLTFDQSILKLKRIQSMYAVFQSHIRVPITTKTKARYQVTVYVPLTDPIFQTDRIIDHIHPSKMGEYVQFVFETYQDNRGIGRSWIE